ncbi:hypothetical protein [Ruegeria lacuscaerulensis]|uniref:hypothetical protein n=1 Tax=Ruegeria lacuscaerulensis TaxID=55218 RepID=UPI00147BCF7D|nr:hypothetical protein [Ruegeria lacuscaerulensis]
MTDHEKQLVFQRLRNRQIEALELASSWSAQLSYQNAAPAISVANEVINQWDDTWFSDETSCPEPIYTKPEETALREYSRVLADLCQRTPSPLPELSTVFALSEWNELREAAQSSLKVMMIRGKF